MSLFLLGLFQLSAGVLLYSCFSRASFTSKANTRRPIRWVFTILGVMACVCLFAPWLTDYEPDGMAAALVAQLALTQLVTSHFWHAGVPPQFQKDQA